MPCALVHTNTGHGLCYRLHELAEESHNAQASPACGPENLERPHVTLHRDSTARVIHLVAKSSPSRVSQRRNHTNVKSFTSWAEYSSAIKNALKRERERENLERPSPCATSGMRFRDFNPAHVLHASRHTPATFMVLFTHATFMVTETRLIDRPKTRALGLALAARRTDSTGTGAPHQSQGGDSTNARLASLSKHTLVCS
jgi:hypothetical protein